MPTPSLIIRRLLESDAAEFDDAESLSQQVARDLSDGGVPFDVGDTVMLKGYGTPVTILAIQGSSAEVWGVDYHGPIALTRLEPYLKEAEEEDEETIKDVLGPDYLDAPTIDDETTGRIERFGRWADVEIGNYRFCISYLTPVAVYIPGDGLFRSSREWSNSTIRHIKKWGDYNGFFDGNAPWAQLREQINTMDQSALISLFKAQSKRVRWSKRDAARSTNFRPPSYLKGDSQDRVELEPHREIE